MGDGVDPIRLLLIEDSEDDALLVVNKLRRCGIELRYRRVETAQTMVAALGEEEPDVVISDNGMPTFDAEAALGLLRDTGLDVPFIVVSGQIGEEAAATLMRAGAHDFVLKDSLARLVPAVQRELREAEERRKHRRAQAALTRSEERFRLIAEHLRDVVFRFRPGEPPVLEYISPAIADITGHQPDQLCDDPELIFAAVEPDDRADLRRSWDSAPARPLTTRWRRPDGTVAWIEQRLVTAAGPPGAPAAVEGMLRDITDQVEAARERERLEHQLHQAERLDSLGQLAGGIAHDFNNLLGVISGYAEFVQHELGPDHPCRADVDSIDHAARRAAALTRQLLIFSRLQPSRPELVDVNAVVAETERLLRRTIGEDIEFVIRAEPELDCVLIDRSRLEQIILNLVVNARAAMPDGGRLTIETAAVDERTASADGDLPAGRFVRLTVTDTGCGMSDEVRRRAFEPFFTTKGTGQGSGLGLATVYGAVNEAAGTITLWSEPGRGTRIAIHLPATPRSPATAGGGPETHEDVRGRGERVLVVEDDDAVREIARRILTGNGYEVLALGARDEALRVLRGEDRAFDLLLSDVIMPGMPALEFIDAVCGERPSIHVVFMSGYTADAAKGGRGLPDSIPLVAKPFEAAVLLRAVRAALDGEPAPSGIIPAPGRGAG